MAAKSNKPLKMRTDPLAKVTASRKRSESAKKGARGLGRQKRDKYGQFSS